MPKPSSKQEKPMEPWLSRSSALQQHPQLLTQPHSLLLTVTPLFGIHHAIHNALGSSERILQIFPSAFCKAQVQLISLFIFNLKSCLSLQETSAAVFPPLHAAAGLQHSKTCRSSVAREPTLNSYSFSLKQ